jgi:membrane-anchored glycerophosphoryl diester phosphodiesterase (GDPDase)
MAMAIAAHRELKIGVIIDKSLAVLERVVAPALIFFVALTAANAAIGYFTANAAPLSQLAATPLRIVIAVFFSYQLLNVMVTRTGLRSRGGADVFLTYFGLTVLYGLAVAVGFMLLVIPALFLISRWSLAQPLVVARGEGVMKAFGESWERTSGNEFPIIAAVLVLVIAPQALSVATGMMFPKDSLLGIGLSQALASVASVLGLAMGVALYGMIIGTPKEVAATFE